MRVSREEGKRGWRGGTGVGGWRAPGTRPAARPLVPELHTVVSHTAKPLLPDLRSRGERPGLIRTRHRGIQP